MTLSVISLDSNEDEEPKKEEEARSEVVGVNGIDEVDESKYTTASNATAAEKDISDEVSVYLFFLGILHSIYTLAFAHYEFCTVRILPIMVDFNNFSNSVSIVSSKILYACF